MSSQTFDRLARPYRLMERLVFGRALERARAAQLAHVAGSRRALYLGCGDGAGVAALLRAAPDCRVDCIDYGEAMVARARQRVAREAPNASQRVTFRVADVLTYQPELGAYDLVVSHFFLDCFPADEIAHIVRMGCSSASPGARWLLADFRIPAPSEGWFRRLRARLWLWALYRFFALSTSIRARRLVAPDPCFAAHGLRLEGELLTRGGLLRSTVWRLPD